jgi:hypothetical protein
MFRDRHDFSAIAVSMERVGSVRDTLSLLPSDSISEPELFASSDGFEALHLYYHSQERFSRSPELEEVRVVWNGVEQYRYNMYIIGVKVAGRVVLLLSVPFFLMGRSVFSRLVKAAHGLGLVFHFVDLKRLTEAIQAGRNDGGLVKLVRVEMLIHGDTYVDKILLAGTDVMSSLTYEELSRASEVAQTSLAPRRCTMVFDDHERPRFVLSADRYGNFTYRVSRGAENISVGRDLLSFLYQENLVGETFAFPPARGAEEEG